MNEFRGVWIASVKNIDWPSKPGLSSEAQQREFLEILSMHKSNGLNAVVVQVRPAADAFYPSAYEPWSIWLTGELGKAPFPYYDPLKFMISETHKLGMEFHAWFNPYRAVVDVDTSNIHRASVAYTHPGWFLKYDKNLYFDPGNPDARKHVVNVILDVVNRYDVDGIHFDDYFYPYKVSGLAFPDSASYKLHGNGFHNIDDWRRNNVDLLIKQISDSLRSVKPHVHFGISPFGVWRNQEKDPKGSATKAGQTCYDDLYADVLKWMKEGWIDYVTPQIYWSIGFTPASYDVLAKWWNENSNNIPIYVGQAAYRINSNNSDTRWKENDQIPRQLRLNRTLPNIQGSVFFSSRSFKTNPLGINDSLKGKYYRYPCAAPAIKGSTFSSQYPITFTTDTDGIVLRWIETNELSNLSSHSRYIIFKFDDREKVDLTNPQKILAIVSNTNPYTNRVQSFKDTSARLRKKYKYVVVGLDRFRNESMPTEAFPVKKFKKYWRTYPPVRI